MSQAIGVEGLSKRYTIYHQVRGRQETIREALVRAASRLCGRAARGLPVGGKMSTLPKKEEFWALQDVTFNVDRGERVGIIGRNGAGKSTLLKILSRITEPTSGRVCGRGRVASLLEVGTGFHPELTGRENIFLNGAILGMGKAEIRSRFDEIVAFAEVEKFIDTPVKRYSSGMYVRLAFAVAAHLRADILMVDEVLSVGDAEFQKKCLGKIDDISRSGLTVLFVSHNMATVRTLCSRGVYLKDGKTAFVGAMDEAIAAYLASGDSHRHPLLELAQDPSLPMQLEHISVLSESGDVQHTIDYMEPFRVRIRTRVRTPLAAAYVALHIHDAKSLETILFSRDFQYDSLQPRAREPGVYSCEARIPAPLLVPGQYLLSVHVVRFSKPGSEILTRVDHVCPFEVVDNRSPQARIGLPWQGRIATPIVWEDVTRCAEKGP
ncbi:MAG: ABC transporter ATP-binding protein [Proteobacteria bacterium]|nr:ABC transporter ATP-binding protein [Pseudomonadota bacterium]